MEYQSLEKGESFVAPQKGIYASDEVAKELLGIIGDKKSDVLKENIER